MVESDSHGVNFMNGLSFQMTDSPQAEVRYTARG